MYRLINKKEGTILEVSQDIIDFLELGNVEIDEKGKHFIFNNQIWYLQLPEYKVDLPKDCIKSGRAVGNSTRLLDHYVQKLFNKGYVKIVDHYENTEASEHLFFKFLKRLKLEHPGVRLEANRLNRTVRLKR